MFVAQTRKLQGRKNVLSAVAFAMLLSASSGAMADCNGTGVLGVGGITPFLPFASGGAVNALVSAINTTNTAFLTQSTAFVSAPPNPQPNQEGGGVWARAIGGDITTKSTSTTSNVSVLGVAVPGNITCNNQTKLTFAGVQTGTDIARLNVGGWNLHVGGTVGYLGAKATDTSSAGPLNPLGGTFQNTLQVPFAGIYGAATKGGFFVDGQVRVDFFQNSLNDPITSGIFNQKLDARGVSVTGNIGYNQSFQNNWFIEPSAGIVISKVKVDPLNVTGTGLLNAPAAGTFPGQLRIDDINSTLGRLSIRGGTSLVSGNIIWQPFAIASVYHEFGGAVGSSFNGDAVTAFTGVPGLPRGTVSSTNLGTYGQFGIGVAAQIVNTGWLGYVRADYRTGDNIEGYSVNGGIRYQFTPDLVATPRYAKAPALKAPVMPGAYNWTGFYVGGSFGVLNGHTDYDFVASGATANPRFAGALGGAQAGYDYQTGKWVFGVEGSLNASNAHGAKFCPPNIFYTCESFVDWIGTATGRVGYALWDRALFYARGGLAFGNTKIMAECNTGPFNPFGLTNCGQSDTKASAGWTIGYGTEFALARSWTVRAETNYYDLGTTRFTVPGPPVAIDVHEKGFISTVGINYRFAPGVVVAKY